jgi:O-antigen/teichoic acid export membrane protein
MKSNPLHALFVRATYAFSGTLVGRLSAAAAGVVMARSLQAEMFGVYSALWELSLLCGSFTDTGMTVGMQREGANDPSKLGGLLGNALFVRAVIGFPALVVAYFFSSKMTAGHSYGLVYTFLALASAAVFLSEPMYSVLQVLGRQRTVAAIESLRGISSLVGIAALVILKRGVTEMACLQAVIYVAIFVWLTVTTLRASPLAFDIGETVAQFKSSFVYGISGLVFSLYSRIPFLYLSYFKGPVAVGYYAAAYRILSVLYVVGAGAYQRAFLPSLFGLHGRDIGAFRRAGNFMQKYFFIVGFASAIALYIAADSIILLLMGHKYAPSIGIMRFLSLSVFFGFPLYSGDACMTAADKNIRKIVFQVIGTAVGAAAGLFLIRRFGIWGTAATDILIRLVLLAMFLSYTYKMRFMDFESIARFIPAFSLAVAGSIAAVYLMPHSLVVRPLVMGAAVSAIMLVSLGPAYLKNVVSFMRPKKSGEVPC